MIRAATLALLFCATPALAQYRYGYPPPGAYMPIPPPGGYRQNDCYDEDCVRQFYQYRGPNYRPPRQDVEPMCRDYRNRLVPCRFLVPE